MSFICLIIFIGDFLLIGEIQEEVNEVLRRGRGECYRVPFPRMKLFIHLGYEKLANWLMLWVSLKAFAPSPHPTQKSFSESSPPIPVPCRTQKSRSMWAPPVTQVPSAHLPRQEHKGGGWPCFWEGGWALKNQQQKGLTSWWAAAAVTSRACVFSSGRFFYGLWETKGTGQGEVGAVKVWPPPSFKKPTVLNCVCLWSWVTVTSEPGWEPEGTTERFERMNFSVNRSDGRTTLQIGFTKFRPAGWPKEKAQRGRHWPSQKFVWRHHRSLWATGTWDHMFCFLCDGCTSLFRRRVEMRSQGPPGIGRVWIQVPGSLKHWFVDSGICIGLGIELTKIFNFWMM